MNNNDNFNIFSSPAIQDDNELFPSFAFVMNDFPGKSDLFNSIKQYDFEDKVEEENHHHESSTDLSQSHKDKPLMSDSESLSSSPKVEKVISGPDYNSWVDEILEIAENRTNEESIEKPASKEVIIRNRRKLTKKELSFLEQEYEKTNGMNWDKAYISMLAKKISLPYYKVYKWNWDRKKKDSQAHRLPASF